MKPSLENEYRTIRTMLLYGIPSCNILSVCKPPRLGWRWAPSAAVAKGLPGKSLRNCKYLKLRRPPHSGIGKPSSAESVPLCRVGPAVLGLEVACLDVSKLGGEL